MTTQHMTFAELVQEIEQATPVMISIDFFHSVRRNFNWHEKEASYEAEVSVLFSFEPLDLELEKKGTVEEIIEWFSEDVLPLFKHKGGQSFKPLEIFGDFCAADWNQAKTSEAEWEPTWPEVIQILDKRYGELKRFEITDLLKPERGE